jgi:hypothetical protein
MGAPSDCRWRPDARRFIGRGAPTAGLSLCIIVTHYVTECGGGQRIFCNGLRYMFNGSPATVLGHLLNYVSVLPITLEIALAAPALALPHGDQFDRIIAATAKLHRLALITKDANTTGASVVDTVW